MAHCDVCCLRLSLTKLKTLPKHYTDDTNGFWSYGAQKECAGSGSRRYTADRDLYGGCRRPRSRQSCPCCGTTMTLNKNGKYPKHDGPVGRCSLSYANSR